MKSVALSLLMLASLAFAAESAKYTGTGKWQSSNGKSGTYTETMTTSGNTFESVYQFKLGETTKNESIKGTVQPGENGFFKVVLGDNKGTADGYCNEKGTACHWAMKTDDGWVEESFVVHKDHIHKIGSKSMKDVTVHWEETLTKAQ